MVVVKVTNCWKEPIVLSKEFFRHRHLVQDNIGHWKFPQLSRSSNVQLLKGRSQRSRWSSPAGGLVPFAGLEKFPEVFLVMG